jgi:hypothetical protein
MEETITRPKITRNAAKVRAIGAQLHMSDSEVVETILDSLSSYQIERILTFKISHSSPPAQTRELTIRRIDKPRF